MVQPDAGSLRVSDQERDAVTEQLQDSLDAGRISLGEFDARVKAVYDALTYTELNRLLADLPGAVPAVPPAAGQQVVRAESKGSGVPENGFGTGALACGLFAVPIFFPFAILAIVFGAIEIARTNRGAPGSRAQAVAGLILGSISLPVWSIIIVLSTLF